MREWNATQELEGWREAWSRHANERLQALGIEARIDHRSFVAQEIKFEPQNKIGPAGARRLERGPGGRAGRRNTVRSPVAMASGSSAIRPSDWMRSATSRRRSRARILHGSRTGTATTKISSTG